MATTDARDQMTLTFGRLLQAFDAADPRTSIFDPAFAGIYHHAVAGFAAGDADLSVPHVIPSMNITEQRKASNAVAMFDRADDAMEFLARYLTQAERDQIDNAVTTYQDWRRSDPNPRDARVDEPLLALGVDPRFTNFHVFIDRAVADEPTDFESFGPYENEHERDGTFDIAYDNLSEDEKRGIALAPLIRWVADALPRFRFTSLVDDVHPPKNMSRIGERDRRTFWVEVARMLMAEGAIKPGDRIGDQALLYSEAEAEKQLFRLEQRIRKTGSNELQARDGRYLFVPNEDTFSDLQFDGRRKAPKIRRLREGFPFETVDPDSPIKLIDRTVSGCSPLDTARLIPNKVSQYLTILDKRFQEQQDQVFMMGRRAEIIEKPEDYHNIFFDSKRLSAEQLQYTIAALFKKFTGEWIDNNATASAIMARPERAKRLRSIPPGGGRHHFGPQHHDFRPPFAMPRRLTNIAMSGQRSWGRL